MRADADDMTNQTEQTATVPPLPPLPPPPPPPGAATKGTWRRTPVFRDPDRGRVAGVVAGLTRSFGFDLRTTRIAVVIATLVMPALLLVYAAAWLILPPRPEEAVALEDVFRDRRRLPLLIAIGIVIAAGGLGSLGSWFFFGGAPWGLVLIAIGVLLWAGPALIGRGDDPATSTTTGSTTTTSTGATGSTGSTTWAAPTGGAPYPADTVVDRSGADDHIATAGHPAGPAAVTVPPVPASRPRRRRYPVTTVSLAIAVVVAAIASLGESADWWDAPALTIVAIGVGLVGAGMMLSAIVNRSFLLVPLLVPLAAVFTFLVTVEPNLDGGSGDRTVRPTTVEGALEHQELAAGQLTIDLRDVPVGADPADFTVRAEVGLGRLHVLVPDDVTLDVRADVGAGEVRVDDVETASGYRFDDDRVVQADGSPVRTVILDLEVGAGQIDIDRVAAVG